MWFSDSQPDTRRLAWRRGPWLLLRRSQFHNMDNAIVIALTGVFGSLLGGSASAATAWVTQRTSNKRKEFHAELTRRETLYGQFINECSARALDSLENTLDKSERLLSIYSLLNRIRLCASGAVLK